MSAICSIARGLTRLGLAVVALVLTGCVSAKYQRAPESSIAPKLNLVTRTTALDAHVQSVIVYQGPGSWKKEAFWDEYVVSFANRGAAPITIESVSLIDGLDQEQFPGADPWVLEKLSRTNLKKFEHHGKQILVGAGLGVAWTLSPVAVVAGGLGGSTTLAAVGLATFFAIPAVVVGDVIVSHNAKVSIAAEFNHRRMPVPLTLETEAVANGSLFFPVSPGPQRLQIAGHSGDTPLKVTIDLAPLAGLHFLKQPALPSPPASSPKF